jgi:hypothetical protein
MTDYVRMIALGGTIGVLVAGSLAAPQFMSALADEALEPVQEVASTLDELFGPGTVDSKAFRKYNVVIDDTVSTEVLRTRTVSKIGYGRKSIVTIVTTATGTYSTDAMLSPHVRYPGIGVTPRDGGSEFVFRYDQRTPNGYWSLTTKGSFTYINYLQSTRT